MVIEYINTCLGVAFGIFAILAIVVIVGIGLKKDNNKKEDVKNV